ncbi:hypothetical protein AB5J62_22975 [Amycolatopsis sp. cg5]|uniref:nSTAND1 domain-containing NTPase n=1 Tax=Amycolatopsis sp. cg5 TaxID=3238802 RepID=UPI0035263CDF
MTEREGLFRTQLRELMAGAGYRTLQQLQDGARRRGVQLPVSTVNRALTADKLPTAEFVRRFVAACEGDVEHWIELREQIVDQRFAQRPAPEPELPDAVCPYLGLESFDAEHARFYFGRERVVADLVGRLAATTLLFVVGPSGAGKSSLLGAGLIPAVRAGRIPGSRTWRCVTMTPTAHPSLEPLDADTVLIVDQFEELFTQCAGEDERLSFVAALSETRARVVIGLRADFYGHCTAYPHLLAALRVGTMPLGPMCEAELHEVIEKPARAVGLRVERGLADVVLAELGAEPGALPLLAHALFATWQHREDGVLTLAGYRLTGGLHGAIAATAERAYLTLDPPDQDTARRLLLRMIQIGDGTDDTRCPVQLEGESLDCGVLESLAAARLVTLNSATAQIAHDVVIRAWPRLRDWVDADRTRLLVRQRLTDAAEQWEREGRHHSGLYGEPRLGAARQFVTPADTDLRPVTREFLTASIARVRRHRRATGARRFAVAALVAVVASAAIVAVRSHQEVARQERIALARTAAYEAIGVRGTDPELAGQLSLAAFRMAPTAETRGSLISSLVTPNPTQLSGNDATDAVRTVAYSPSGSLLAVGGHDRLVRLTGTGSPRVLRGHEDTVRAVSFSPDEHWLASASQDDTVRIWNVTTAGQVAVLAQSDDVRDVEFSSDGILLATAGHDDLVRLWNVHDPASPVPLGTMSHGDDVYTVAMRGRLLASGGKEGVVRLWDISDPRVPATISAEIRHAGFVNDVAFSRDGRTLVTSGTDATARLWDITDPAKPTFLAVLAGHTAPVHGVAFSPDSRLLATTSVDVTARLWDVSDPRRPVALAAPLAGHTDNVYTAAFSPDGHTLATGSHDRTVKVWEIDMDRIAALVCQRGRITAQQWARYFGDTEFTPPCR